MGLIIVGARTQPRNHDLNWLKKRDKTPVPQLTFNPNIGFIFHCDYLNRHLAKNAGLKWNIYDRRWWTRDAGVAEGLREYADESAKEELEKTVLRVEPWPAPLTPVPECLELLPHQVGAIQYALARNRCYLGMDPGLGKTIVAARVFEELSRAQSGTRCIYACPPFLVQNVIREFKKWAPHAQVGAPRVVRGKKEFPNAQLFNVFLLPDSLLSVSNPEPILEACRAFMSDATTRLLFVDEAHRFKNETTGRTRTLLGSRSVPRPLISCADRIIYMSGTPMPNRPMELYPILSRSAPGTIHGLSHHQFGVRYCSAHRTSFGWDYSGASNVDELAKRVIGPFMLRQKKELLNLPAKIEEVFTLDAVRLPSDAAKLDAALAKVFEAPSASAGAISDEALLKRVLAFNADKDAGEELHVATYRRLLGEAKVPAAIEYLYSILEDSPDEAILVFALHRSVIQELEQGLKKFYPLVVTGDTPVKDRQAIVNAFQEQPLHRVFLGNIQAAGIGFTLTRATRVVFAEYSWVPGENDQASDRAHRIGQKNTVLVQYLVHPHSIDTKVIETLLRKRKTIEQL